MANTEQPFIVAIGASAGGLEALEAFFDYVPKSKPNAAFVVIQHLSPNHKSMMPELLARHTSLPITKVDQVTKLESNHIYLNSPKSSFVFKNGLLLKKDHLHDDKLHLPIDVFFEEMAVESGHRCAGVILSGTGSDGTRGCRIVKEHGGLVLVQQPSEAQFDGMPQSVLEHNLADFILSTTNMWSTIEKIILEDRTIQDRPNANEIKLRVVLDMLYDLYGVDFIDYRRSTIVRRIERRILVNNCKTWDDYILLLKKKSSELRTLHEEILIGVTKFYRDSESFKLLSSQYIPELIQSKNKQEPLRIWVAGCSTGEEAYTIAILLYEYFEKTGEYREFKIFATDVDRAALDRASSGVYPESIAADLNSEWIEKYFRREGKNYIVQSKLRRQITFAHHNMLADPPYTRIDMVSCRNVLIYFLPELQRRVLGFLHFALHINGLLFLGSSESLGTLANEFHVKNARAKIFAKVRNTRLVDLQGIQERQGSGHSTSKVSTGNLISGRPERKDVQLLNHYSELLSLFIQAGFLISEERKVIHIFGQASNYVQIAAGQVSNHIDNMLGSELTQIISSGLSRLSTKQEMFTLNNVFVTDNRGKAQSLEVTFRPLQRASQAVLQNYFVSIIDKTAESNKNEAIPIEDFRSTDFTSSRVRDLEYELQNTREKLQALVEEQEATNEELQSANEELSSANEELQSSNEELHSLNEELSTINSEHQRKIAELQEASNDIEFLLRTSKIGIVFLGRHLEIRRFNPGISPLVNLMPHDIGRGFTDLSFNLGKHEIVDKIKRLRSEGGSFNKTLATEEKSYVLYGTALNSASSTGLKNFQGIVISLIDITGIENENAMRKLVGDLNEFNYRLSHDLQKPIRQLTQAGETLSESNLDEEQRESLNKLLTNASLLGNMMDELLVFSRIRTSGGPIQNCDLETAANRAVKRLESLKKQTNAQILIETVPIVRADLSQIEKLFYVLIKNSLENRDAERRPKISIEAEITGNQAIISVTDNGRGIPKSEQVRVFNMFTKGEANQKTANLGTGLAIARNIARRHATELWIVDFEEDQQGTTISFNLPLSDEQD